MIPYHCRVCQRLVKSETRAGTVWLPGDMERTTLQKSNMKRVCILPPNKHSSYDVLKSTKREDGVCPTCKRNGDICIIYRCALRCRFPRKHPHSTKEKSLLFELHEMSSRLKQWDMNFKCNSYCYSFCLLRGAISHSSLQKNRLSASQSWWEELGLTPLMCAEKYLLPSVALVAALLVCWRHFG